MNIIEEQIMQHSKGLPADILQEILDFIQFVKLRREQQSNSLQLDLSNLDTMEFKHLEEEFKSYNMVYPHE